MNRALFILLLMCLGVTCYAVVKQSTQLITRTPTPSPAGAAQLQLEVSDLATAQIETSANVNGPWTNWITTNLPPLVLGLGATGQTGFFRLVVSYSNGPYFQQVIWTNSFTQ